jgi:alkyl sulfatase BDS1-like metallo-beta-lactamase superfamily hydrolase
VKSLIYTHPHVDHYGGARGVVSEDDVRLGKVPVLAPEGFLREAVSENVLAGNVMSRRALYMYGRLLPISETGRVDAGLGKGTPVGGGSSLIPPTDSIRATGETRTLDGVEILFQMTPETEAPAEMLLYFPKFKALCAAENATHTLHNLYTLRGAKVRDADKWQRALDEAIDLFADRSEVVFAQHHWPTWGADRVRAFLSAQRDGYKFIHDQTLRLANQGYTPEEISEKLRFPASLDRLWHLRGYYGTLRHDVKAVYQLYLGWFDGHPANLNPLPGREAARRYVRYMGGGEAMLEKARADYAKGDYRWVAEVLKHLVFAEPENQEARDLQADALEQLGYQAESAPWRGFYLTGAQELRRSAAVKPQTQFKSSANPDVVRNMTPEMQLDYLAVRLNADRAEGKSVRFNWKLPSGLVYALTVENSVLLYKKDAPHSAPDATLNLSGEELLSLMDGRTDPAGYFRDRPAALQGDKDKVREFFRLFDSFALFFPIVDREGLN